MMRNVASPMGMATFKCCVNCGDDDVPMRGMYCVRCFNSYRAALRLLNRAEKRFSAASWNFLLRIAARKAKREL